MASKPRFINALSLITFGSYIVFLKTELPCRPVPEILSFLHRFSSCNSHKISDGWVHRALVWIPWLQPGNKTFRATCVFPVWSFVPYLSRQNLNFTGATPANLASLSGFLIFKYGISIILNTIQNQLCFVSSRNAGYFLKFDC